MSKLLNFFFSFDKLMKESLVRAFYWLALIVIAIMFVRQAFWYINFSFFVDVFDFILFFVFALLVVVGLRLKAELAIALFRINDNLSPDGGKSETADIDPIAEARKAAELAAKRASDATKSAVDKTKNMSSRGETDSKPEVKTEPTPKAKAKPAAKKAPVKKTTSAKKATPKTTKAKSTATKKPATKKAPAKKAAPKAEPKT